MNRLALMLMRNALKLPGLYAKLCHYAKNTDKYPEQEKYDHISHIMELAVASGNLELIVTGEDKLPEKDGFIIYGNHQGLFDVVALVATVKRPLAAVFKKELEGIPFLQQIIDCTKSFAMDREDVRQSLTVIQSVIQEVKKGRNYVIFPEGTRSKNGNVMNEFHGGSFRAAVKAKCPIVPITFIDCFKVLDQKGSDPVTVQMHIMDPIPYEEYCDMKTTEIAAMVKARIQAVIDTNT